MIMSMCKVICVTNRHLAGEDFLERIKKIASAKAAGIILREKDLPAAEYIDLAEKVQKICREAYIPLILHTYVKAAKELGIRKIHLPWREFSALEQKERDWFEWIGVSIHKPEEAADAEKLGASFLVAGHIFATRCKKGKPPRGTDFLKEICSNAVIPVYAIGGIGPENAAFCMEAGAKGVCLMSSLMQTEHPEQLIRQLSGEEHLTDL